MSTTTDLTELKINYLTQAQYDAEVSGGTINEDEIYMTPVANIITTEVNDTYAMTTSLKTIYTYTCTRNAVIVASFYPAYGGSQPKQSRIRVNDTYNMAIASGNTDWENAQCSGVAVVSAGDTIVFACSYKAAGNNAARVTIADIPL